MAEKSRVEMLAEFVAEKPTDAFSRYGYAMELKRLGKSEEALAQFRTLHEKNPDYVPSYLMHGQFLVQLTRMDEARKVLESGVAAAKKMGNMHALGEISDALAAIGD